MRPFEGQRVRVSGAKASQPPPLFLPIADAAPTRSAALLIAPTRLQDRHDEVRCELNREAGRGHKAVSSWPLLVKPGAPSGGNAVPKSRNQSAAARVQPKQARPDEDGRLEATRRVYETSRAAVVVKTRKRERTPPPTLQLDPLRRIMRQQETLMEQQDRLQRSMESRIDDVSRDAALRRFILGQERHHAFAQRTALLGMCRALKAHYARVVRVGWFVWKKYTLTLHVLEEHEQKLFLLRQTSLAHACAIIQRSVLDQMRGLWTRWRHHVDILRFIEHQRCARRIQKCWRSWRMHNKLKMLAILYRERVRVESATRIQCCVRCYLARCEMARVVWLHQRHVAAIRIQNAFRNYVVCQIAKRQWQQVAAVDVQRIWRGFLGRQRAMMRLVACHHAVVYACTNLWSPQACRSVEKKHDSASRIQRCFVASSYRQRLERGMRVAKYRRRFFPASTIQRVWHVYRYRQLQHVVESLVFRVVMTHIAATRRIQQAFRGYHQAKIERSARRLTRLFRVFESKRVVCSRILVKARLGRATKVNRWYEASKINANSRWSATLKALRDGIEHYERDQNRGAYRLHVGNGIRLILKMNQLETRLLSSHIGHIQRVWRWHRLCVLLRKLRQASRLLHRALPRLFRQYKRRRQRRRVLQRWKRQRFTELRDRFSHWKTQHLLLIQARDLATSTRKLRKTLWFHHHKLRKRMLGQWWRYLLRIRLKHAKMCAAIAKDTVISKRRAWRAWRYEALPRLCCANRLQDISTLLTVWKTWIEYAECKRKSKEAREHFRRHLKSNVIAAWEADRDDFNRQLLVAVSFQKSHSTHRAFYALKHLTQKLQTVQRFCQDKHRALAIRRWVLRTRVTAYYRAVEQRADALRRSQLLRSSIAQWIRYRRHQIREKTTLHSMEEYYMRRRMRHIIHRWSTDLVPMWRDYRLIESVAAAYRERLLTQRIFQKGFARFWAITAGTRRIAMAIRIQRAYRAKRARRSIFVVRMKIRYQLEAHAAKGTDVSSFSPKSLQAALTEYEWVFALFTYPWSPVSTSGREGFCKTATAWTFARSEGRRMAFGTIDATSVITIEEQDFSVISWLGIQPGELPCVVGFWQGVGPAVSVEGCTSRLMSGEICQLRRRYKVVCADDSRDLVYRCVRDGSTVDSALQLSKLVPWIQSLRDTAREATATDLQSYVRGYLARRHTKRKRVLVKQRQSQRIRQWICNLKSQWISNKRETAAIKVQRWIRHIHARCRFLETLRREMLSANNAASRIQYFTRVQFARRQLRLGLIFLLASAAKYPNSPLCEECFVKAPTLAQLRCRDCQQVFCAECFWKVHSSGKRLLHLTDTIDFVKLNEMDTRICEKCDVRAASRVCSSCVTEKTTWLHLCTGCFELMHTDVVERTHVHNAECQHRQLAWWESKKFRMHQWQRLFQTPGPADCQSSASVMKKFGWQSLKLIHFQQAEAAKAEESQREREERLLAIRVQQEAILRDAFDRYDTDKSGSIDRDEFRRMFKEELCEPLSDGQVDQAMKAMDKSGNGQIEFDELLTWFAEDILTKEEQGDIKGDTPSLVLLKEALKAKRQMKRYKEKLDEFVPSVSLRVPHGRVLHELTEKLLEKKPTKKKVPGFPSVECLEHSAFARKRKVFFRFVHEICGLDWIYEDEATIPVTNAMEVFDQVFVPKWNAGELTYDFYFDEESFEFEGETWQRHWDTSTKRYFYTTTRRKTRTVAVTPGHGRKGSSGKKRRRSSVREKLTEEVEEAVEIVEAIDPRRKEMLLEQAREAFKKADADGSGFIDEHEFHRMLTLELCEPVSKKQAREIMKQLDADGSGKIDFHEFFQWYAIEKCQDYPLTPQMERTQALLRTRRRAKATAIAALKAGVVGGVTLKDAIERKRKEQQLIRDCKGASTELITLLQEGFEKRLAEKALTLHNEDVEFARKWLRDKLDEKEREREATRRDKADKKARARKDARVRKTQRRDKIKTMRQKLKLLLVGPSKKEAHAARVQQALTNFDREIMLVEHQLAAQ